MKWSGKIALVLVAVGSAIFTLAGGAAAADVTVEVSAPAQADVGAQVEIQGTVHSTADGSPVADAPVTFYTKESFGDVTGDVVLGTAVTDENGVALLSYEPRVAGDQEIRAAYVAEEGAQPVEATAVMTVAGSASQLSHSTAGVRIPGLNVWLLMAVVSAVWMVLLSVAARVVAIARAAGEQPAPSYAAAAAPVRAGSQAAGVESGATGAR